MTSKRKVDAKNNWERSKPPKRELAGAFDAVQLSNVALVRDGRTILESISWRIRDGEHWAVVGANGSGKTTLLKIVAGYAWPTQGKVSVLGNDFGTVDLRELRKDIGWVSSALQDEVPPGESAVDVVLSGRFASIGLWDEGDVRDAERANRLLKFMGCGECGSRPFGVLSQGEQQRILIARALMPEPRLLILDEPCAGLDLAAREGFLETLQELGQEEAGPTLILVTHRIEEIVSTFSHILLLKAGRILAQGRKEKVLTESMLSDAFGVYLDVARVNDRFWPQIR